MTRTATSTAPRTQRWAAFACAGDLGFQLLMSGVPSYVIKAEQPRGQMPG